MLMFFGIVFLICIIIGVFESIHLEEKQRKAREEIEDRNKRAKREWKNKIESITMRMKQEKRFQEFLENLKTVLKNYRTEIEYVVIDNMGIYIYLNSEKRRWNIDGSGIRIEYNDYQFRLPGDDDEIAMAYLIVQEVPFMVYKVNKNGGEYETKDVMEAYFNYDKYGEWENRSKKIYIKDNNF